MKSAAFRARDVVGALSLSRQVLVAVFPKAARSRVANQAELLGRCSQETAELVARCSRIQTSLVHRDTCLHPPCFHRLKSGESCKKLLLSGQVTRALST